MEGPDTMVTVALFVRIEAKPGKEVAVQEFLKNGLQIVESEPATVAWFSLRLGPSTFGIFDAFQDDAGRNTSFLTPSTTGTASASRNVTLVPRAASRIFAAASCRIRA
jgi:hypothetical protein